MSYIYSILPSNEIRVAQITSITYTVQTNGCVEIAYKIAEHNHVYPPNVFDTLEAATAAFELWGYRSSYRHLIAGKVNVEYKSSRLGMTTDPRGFATPPEEFKKG